MRIQLERLKLTYAGAIVLVVISLGLFAVQATVWVKATAHAQSETVTQNKLGSHPPSETAGLAGMLLLVLTGTALWARNAWARAPDGTTSSVGYSSTPARFGISLSLRR